MPLDSLIQAHHVSNFVTVSGPPFFSGFVNAAPFALLYYDYFLTFDREVNWVWLASPKLTWTTVCFFLVRYSAIVGHIAVGFYHFWTDEHLARFPVCSALLTFHELLGYFLHVVTGVLLLVRTYALYNKNKKVLCGLILVAVVLATCGISLMFYNREIKTPRTLPESGCLFGVPKDRAQRLIAVWACVFIFDTIIFALTVIKTCHTARKTKSPVLLVFQRDGVAYFAVMSIASLLVIASFANVPEGSRRLGIMPVANTLVTILVSRLVLNLRDPSLSRKPYINSENQGLDNTKTTMEPFVMTTLFDTRDESAV
ncbi:hypothetical protein FA15DRAFT_672790 [Coprinopsis marcescibilis]|uniref:DUF6533 domain-containing protein n=1 Tax=Coprinopsis marcescibilis TaxID=230819 RepID=A0A5C3KMA7_COPMA|nr:hypothetical protein FA15DRAFT_672790 [Coprinopsis marcescibilis]